MKHEAVKIDVGGAGTVSGLLTVPGARARAVMVVGHGAGAGMNHPFLATVATGLGARGIATLRYQFPYMEQGAKRPDSPATAHATVRAAVAAAARLCTGLPLFAGGKSFGGRMTSQALADHRTEGDPLSLVRGLAFLGFPLHPPKKPGTQRAKHLGDVSVPMLFIQGTRDELADLSLLRPIVKGLGARATLLVIEGAEHSFHVLKRSGRTDDAVMEEVLDGLAAWMERIS